ncbi:MAG: helix-turn-helix domain-containing protein [Actinomycetota bacterium]|nr:helix-turn-helix domain-containing protein [Actinomycetota bacterium]
MKGSVGTTTSIYHTRLPHQRKLERLGKWLDLSKEARVRLSWLAHYKKHKNVSLTCRRFGISRNTLYKWVGRYHRLGPRGLEDLPGPPKGGGYPEYPGRRWSSSATCAGSIPPGPSTSWR